MENETLPSKLTITLSRSVVLAITEGLKILNVQQKLGQVPSMPPLTKIKNEFNLAVKGRDTAQELWTLQEVAEYLGLHVMTVYKLTREGQIPAAKLGGQWRFVPEVLHKWLSEQMKDKEVSA